MKLTRKQGKRFLSNIDYKVGECWNWTGYVLDRKKGRNYGVIAFNCKTFRAHRLMFALYHGSIPDGMLIRHTCHNQSCVNPEHLVEGTNVDNMRDMVEAGRSLRGEQHNLAKLTEAQVLAIRSEYVPKKVGYTTLAQKYNVSRSNIRFIVKRGSWQHI